MEKVYKVIRAMKKQVFNSLQRLMNILIVTKKTI